MTLCFIIHEIKYAVAEKQRHAHYTRDQYRTRMMKWMNNIQRRMMKDIKRPEKYIPAIPAKEATHIDAIPRAEK